MSCHDIIRNQWITQVITPAEYIEYLEDELSDKYYISSYDYEQALREIDRLDEDVYRYEEKISELIDEIENLSSELSLLRYKYE